MTSSILEDKYQSHNNFLKKQINRRVNTGLGYNEYKFKWGSVSSFLDIKTGDAGIIVEYK